MIQYQYTVVQAIAYCNNAKQEILDILKENGSFVELSPVPILYCVWCVIRMIWDS